MFLCYLDPLQENKMQFVLAFVFLLSGVQYPLIGKFCWMLMIYTYMYVYMYTCMTLHVHTVLPNFSMYTVVSIFTSHVPRLSPARVCNYCE